MLDDVVIPLEFEGLHAANLVGWSGSLPHDGFDALARAVEGILTSAAQPVKALAAEAERKGEEEQLAREAAAAKRRAEEEQGYG
jgi:hypothetical protein